MMKLSRSLLSRNLNVETLVSGKSADVRDALRLHAFTSRAGISSFGQDVAAKAKPSGRVSAPYTIYKGKAALSVEPRLPTFSKLDSGYIRVNRKGVMMLTFWPAISERKYDWEKRLMFALSPTEVGSLISIGPHDSSEFFHDPSMLSSNAGQVRKTLSIKAHDNGGGYFITLNVNNNILKSNERISVPVTTAEFAVMKNACSFALPHLMGWDRLTNQLTGGVEQSSSMVGRRSSDLEWKR